MTERQSFKIDPVKGLVPVIKETKFNADAPYVKRDEIVGGIESWVDGQTYDSKSKLRQSYKKHGVVEKGNDRLPPRKLQTDAERRDDIHEDTTQAYYDLKYDRAKLNDWEKEKCHRELRATSRERERRRTKWAR